MARVAVLVSLAALFLSSCSEARLRPDQRVHANCPTAGDDYFFPRGIFSKSNSDFDQFARHWYSESLMRMGEPSLSCDPTNDTETYRFLWLRTFAHPISVRISRNLHNVSIEAFELSGAGGYDPGHVSKHISKVVPASDWDRLEAALGRLNFWDLPTETSPTEIGADGAEWIIEGQRSGTYHVLDRWSPQGAYKNLGLLFLDIAGFSLPTQR
jgi:hypothetical protein